MAVRPDLFDAHSVHWHGFPQAASVFDGVPDASISINMGASLTYYYKANDAGTYMYHCHVVHWKDWSGSLKRLRFVMYWLPVVTRYYSPMTNWRT